MPIQYSQEAAYVAAYGIIKRGMTGGVPLPIPFIGESRYFRRNEGTIDYATIPEVTLSGDFVIEFDCLKSGMEDAMAFSGGASGEFGLLINRFNRFAIRFNGAYEVGITDVFSSNSIYSIRMVRQSGAISVYANNSLAVSRASSAGDFYISNILNAIHNSKLKLKGIPANLKIYDNGTLIRDYPLDEPKGTSVFYDNVGGNNGTIINGNDDDKGLFTEQANGDWLGEELSNKTEARLPAEYVSGTYNYWNVNQAVAGLTYRITCDLIGPISLGVNSAGWSTQTGIPVTQAFRSIDGSIGVYGGDYTASTSDNQRVYYSYSTGATEFDSISVKEVLKSA